MYEIFIKKISFVWSEVKNKINFEKHGISFEEATTVFDDPNAVEFYDHGHSEAEDRFLMLGMSSALRLLLVCHQYSEREGEIRIFSARKATKTEIQEYLI